MTSGPPLALHVFPLEAFPINVQFEAVASGVVVHEFTVDGPDMVRVPALAASHGPVVVRVTFGDGETIEVGPDDV